jgi:hypothetical protein
MGMKVWSKLLLNIYNTLEKVTGAIDKIVEITSLNGSIDAYEGANKIIYLIERKKH